MPEVRLKHMLKGLKDAKKKGHQSFIKLPGSWSSGVKSSMALFSERSRPRGAPPLEPLVMLLGA